MSLASFEQEQEARFLKLERKLFAIEVVLNATMLTVPQVAQTLKCSTQTVRNWCKTGVLNGAIGGTGGQWKIPSLSVVEYAQKRKHIQINF
jgi:transposase